MQERMTLSEHERILVDLAIQEQKEIDAKWFKRGDFATLCLSLVILKFTLVIGLLVMSKNVSGETMDEQFQNKLRAMGWILNGAYVAFFAIVFAHIKFWRAIYLILATFIVVAVGIALLTGAFVPLFL